MVSIQGKKNNAGECVAVILPHTERFQADGAGAGSICVRDALNASALSAITKVLGAEVAKPFDPAHFVPVPLAPWIYGRRTRRYVEGVIRVLRRLVPAYIEVHNRPVYVAALRGAFPRVPIALYLHNDPRTIRGMRTARERMACLDRVSVVICVSEFIRRCMLDGLGHHPRNGKVRVVLNGVDTATIHPAAPEHKEILFLGRIIPQKGALLFAQAAQQIRERLPEWRFVLIGARGFGQSAPDSDYERQVVEAMQHLGGQGEITGYIPRERALARLRHAAIVAAPAQWDDPCPLSVIEALASGCAAVVSPRGGIPEIVADAALMVDRGDAAAWAEQLLAVATDDELRHRYQQAARRRAAEALDIHHASAQLDAIRRELMGEAVPA